MSSNAAEKFIRSFARSDQLRQGALASTRSLDIAERQIYYHAYLAALVASWQAYIEDLVKEYYQVIYLPPYQEYVSLHGIANGLANMILARFNTPNYEKAREILVYCTGYDSIGDWVWPRAGMNRQHVNNFLNEILNVRHSFSHGFAVPPYSWTVSSSGNVRLTSREMIRLGNFFKSVVMKTDKALKQYIETAYNVKAF